MTGSILPYWTIVKVGEASRILNANLDSENGCLVVPSSGAVLLGSCSQAAANEWRVSAAPAVDTYDAPPSSGLNVGAIVGVVIGGIAAIAAIVGAIFLYRRRRKDSTPIKPAVDAESKVIEEPQVDDSQKSPQLTMTTGDLSTATVVNEGPPQGTVALHISFQSSAFSDSIPGTILPASYIASQLPPGSPTSHLSASLPRSKLLITAEEIVVDRNQRLGEGGFGIVYAGMLRGSTKVAVKVCSLLLWFESPADLFLSRLDNQGRHRREDNEGLPPRSGNLGGAGSTQRPPAYCLLHGPPHDGYGPRGTG